MSIVALTLLLVLLVLFGGTTVYIDPFFHYHGPREGQSYSLYNERYQNDGITRNFSYDAVITGTSMTQNFKASEFNQLFGLQSIKVPFAGASYKEINEFLERTITRNSNIKVILRGLDSNRLLVDKDDMRYDSYPDYLYDNNVLNDVNYLLNKEIFVNDTWNALEYDLSGQASVDFDVYSNWNHAYMFGADAVMASYDRADDTGSILSLSEGDADIVLATIEQNVTLLVAENPQIEFYLFFTPYSILYWDSQNQYGNVQRMIDAQRVAIEAMLLYENIHLFSFFNVYDMICDLDNYKDIAHYGENVNSQILHWMSEGTYELTKENYMQYLTEISDFYTNYPYDELFIEKGLAP